MTDRLPPPLRIKPDSGSLSPAPLGKCVWPVIVGTVLIPFGLIGAIMGWRVAVTSSMVLEGWMQAGLFFVLIAGAILLIARTYVSRAVLVTWAVTKMIWSYIYTTSFMAEIETPTKGPEPPASEAIDLMFFIGMFAWGCLLPVSILIVFFVPAIRRQFVTQRNLGISAISV